MCCFELWSHLWVDLHDLLLFLLLLPQVLLVIVVLLLYRLEHGFHLQSGLLLGFLLRLFGLLLQGSPLGTGSVHRVLHVRDFCCTTLDLPLFFRPNVASFIFCSCFFFFSAFAWSFWVAFAAFPFFPMVKKPKQPNKKNLTTPEKTYRSRRQINRPLQLHCPKLYFSLSLSVSGGHLCFRYGRSRVWRRPFFVIPSRIPTD